MSSAPQSARERNGAEAAAEEVAVRAQLKRLLADPLFTNSKRYPVLLAYTVEQALMGNASELKERTIGVEAFGREPNYDVALDPVVRTTAAEVRKRLVQYYYKSEHAGELVIELPLGSYAPCFRTPSNTRRNLQAGLEAAEKAEGIIPLNAPITADLPLAAEKSPLGTIWRWGAIGLSILAAMFVGFGVGRIRISPSPTDMQRFWEPIANAPNRVTYCLGEPAAALDHLTRTEDVLAKYANLNVSDVVTLARSIVPLVPRNGLFRVVGSWHTTFEQLREGPVVLIGAFDNPWTMRITKDLPIRFEYDDHSRRIVDVRGGAQRAWSVQGLMPDAKLAQDYAVVARIHDKVTGQPVILLAGIFGEGTEAASEVVSNPIYLRALLQKAPKNWDQLNLEAVIETQLIDAHPGPPTVVAVETW